MNLKEKFAELASQGMNPLHVQTEVKDIFKIHLLEVKSGNDVFSLLLTSERVYFDLSNWICY